MLLDLGLAGSAWAARCRVAIASASRPRLYCAQPSESVIEASSGRSALRLADHRFGRVEVFAALELAVAEEVEQQRLVGRDRQRQRQFAPWLPASGRASSSALAPEQAQRPALVGAGLASASDRAAISVGGRGMALQFDHRTSPSRAIVAGARAGRRRCRCARASASSGRVHRSADARSASRAWLANGSAVGTVPRMSSASVVGRWSSSNSASSTAPRYCRDWRSGRSGRRRSAARCRCSRAERRGPGRSSVRRRPSAGCRWPPGCCRLESRGLGRRAAPSTIARACARSPAARKPSASASRNRSARPPAAASAAARERRGLGGRLSLSRIARAVRRASGREQRCWRHLVERVERLRVAPLGRAQASTNGARKPPVAVAAVRRRQAASLRSSWPPRSSSATSSSRGRAALGRRHAAGQLQRQRHVAGGDRVADAPGGESSIGRLALGQVGEQLRRPRRVADRVGGPGLDIGRRSVGVARGAAAGPGASAASSDAASDQAGLHVRVIGASSAFRCDPVDVLGRVLDVAGLAVDAILRVDLKPR